MTFSIDLCVDWSKIAECPTGIIDAVVRNLAPGEWRLEGAVAGIDFQSGYSIADVDTVRVVRGGEVLFSGFVAPIDEGTGGLEITSTGTGDTYVLSGPDAWFPLTTRVAYPTPSTEAPWATSHDVRTGAASTVATGYIASNLGSDALTARQIDIAITDAQTGLSGTWTARLQPLHELVARVCRDGRITCRPKINFDGELKVFIGNPRDRSGRTVLSDQGDLVDVHRRLVPPRKSFLVAGGQGELTARAFRTAGSLSGANRFESFLDYSSLGSTTELQQAADTALAAGGSTWSITASLSDTASQRLDYLDDYDIGDLVAVEIDNDRHTVPVEAARIHAGPDLSIVRPVLGTAAPDLLAGLLRDVAGLQSRFATQIA